MLQNAYFLAKIGADTAENERNFAEILQKRRDPAGAPAPSRRVELRERPWLARPVFILASFF